MVSWLELIMFSMAWSCALTSTSWLTGTICLHASLSVCRFPDPVVPLHGGAGMGTAVEETESLAAPPPWPLSGRADNVPTWHWTCVVQLVRGSVCDCRPLSCSAFLRLLRSDGLSRHSTCVREFHAIGPITLEEESSRIFPPLSPEFSNCSLPERSEFQSPLWKPLLCLLSDATDLIVRVVRSRCGLICRTRKYQSIRTRSVCSLQTSLACGVAL